MVAPFPNGVAFLTDDALSFFGGPSKLEVGILDFGGTGNLVAPFPNGVVFLTDASPSFFAGPSKFDIGFINLGGTGNLVTPFPNGVAFFTDDVLSFFGGPSELDKGVLDFGGTGNFAGPLPNSVAFFTDDALSFCAGPLKLEDGIADLDGTGNSVGSPPGDTLLAESSAVVFDARSPTDSFTVSLLLDGNALDGIPNFGNVVSFFSVSPDSEDFSSSCASSELAIVSSSILFRGPLKGGVAIPNFFVPSVLIVDFEVDDEPGMFIFCFGGDPNGADALPKEGALGGGPPKPAFFLGKSCFGKDPNDGVPFLSTLLASERDSVDDSASLESLLMGNESSGFSWSEAAGVGEDPDDSPSL